MCLISENSVRDNELRLVVLGLKAIARWGDNVPAEVSVNESTAMEIDAQAIIGYCRSGDLIAN